MLRSPPSSPDSVGSAPAPTRRGSRARTHSHVGFAIVVPIAGIALLGWLDRPILATLPDCTKFLASLGQPPPHGGLAPSDNRGDLGRGEALQIAEDQDGAVAGRNQVEDELNFLRQIRLDSRI